MPKSQLGNLLAKRQWFWTGQNLKLKVKGRSSEHASIIERKNTYPTSIGLKV